MEYKLKFENGRSCEIYCESDGQPLQDKINAAEKRFGSTVKTINGKEVKEHGLGGFLIGAIIGGFAGNAVAKQGLKKTVKTVAKKSGEVAKKTASTVKKAVASVKKKEPVKSKRSNYIPNRLIDSIETKDGKKIDNKDIIDGAHTKTKVNVSKKRVDATPKNIDKSKKLSMQSDYLSAREIKVINTTYGRKLKGTEIIDGAFVKKGVFADGGAIDKFNWKSFTLVELMSILPDDVKLAFLSTPEKNDINFSDVKEIKPYLKTKWTISDYGNIGLKKGSENLYLDIVVYDLASKSDLENKITIYTKENHQGLKDLASHLIQKFNDGGKTSESDKFNYMMLSRLQSDCDYYLGFGNRNPKVLWAGNEEDHIAEMKKIYNKLPEKPEWLTMEQIEDYESKMKSDEKKFANGGSTDDYTKNLARVKVKFSNPKYDYITSVSGEITESDARQYFVGQVFDMGEYPKENMQRVIDIEFYPKGTYADGGGVEKIPSNLQKQIENATIKIVYPPKKKFATSLDKILDKYISNRSVLDFYEDADDREVIILDMKKVKMSASLFSELKDWESKYLGDVFVIDKMAKGGMTEHGLELNDEIIDDGAEEGADNFIKVFNHKTKEGHLVNLDKGKRFANGGVVGQEIVFNHWSGDVKKGTIEELHSNGEYIVQSGYGSMLVNPDDVISISSPKPEKKFLGIFEDGGAIENQIDILKGSIVEFHYMGVAKPDSAKIISAYQSSPQFRYRDLFLKFEGDTTTQIPSDKVNEFLSGKMTIVKDSKGNEYGIKLTTEKMEEGGVVKSALLTDEENDLTNQIISHPLFKDYKELETFSSGGNNFHTCILLSNGHIVTINYDSGVIQYSYLIYDSIEEYLGESSDGLRGWDNESYTPKAEMNMIYIEDGYNEFFDSKLTK